VNLCLEEYQPSTLYLSIVFDTEDKEDIEGKDMIMENKADHENTNTENSNNNNNNINNNKNGKNNNKKKPLFIHCSIIPDGGFLDTLTDSIKLDRTSSTDTSDPLSIINERKRKLADGEAD
jgi:hypothetical protein